MIPRRSACVKTDVKESCTKIGEKVAKNDENRQISPEESAGSRSCTMYKAICKKSENLFTIAHKNGIIV